MRNVAIILFALALPLFASAKLVEDTLSIGHNGKIILKYDISVNGENVLIRIDDKPRITPSEALRKACKHDLERLKVVIFDRVGDFGKVKWNGMSPAAFMVPSGLSYDKSEDGFFILGETTVPITFKKKGEGKMDISFPLYVAVWEKKQTYRLVDLSSQPLRISVGKSSAGMPQINHAGLETEQITIHSSEEQEGDNEDVVKALSSIQMIRQLLATETEYPFSTVLSMEMVNLKLLRDRINDVDVIEKINDVLLLCNEKERELKAAQREAELAAQAQEQSLLAQQRNEEEARQKEAEEKARIETEKQQKRTFWMIVGGVVLAIIAFIGNAIFRHFRDIRNQKSIMEMQESIAKQAEHEAARRSREIVRNKAHQMANKGKSKMRESLKETGKTKKDPKRKSI